MDDEFNQRVRSLFQLHVERFARESVGKFERKVSDKSDEIEKIASFLRKFRDLQVFSEAQGRKKRLEEENDQTVNRIEEFKCAMKCVMDYLKGNEVEELAVLGFKNGKGFNWNRIHSLLLREYRRLDAELPIYGFRREILQQINSQQVFLDSIEMFDLD